MKGVIFNVFDTFVVERFGADAYEALLDSCTLQTREPFVGPGTYPDADFAELIIKASQQLNLPTPDLLRAFGHFCLPRLVDKLPELLEGHTAKSFLLSVENVVHIEVHKLYADALTPTFRYLDPAPSHLSIQYSSPRRLCHLMEGLLDGVSEHFATTISYHQSQCMLDGAESCVFDLEFLAQQGG
ncbi:MAG TPA: heme NO-binding protein [Gammaproteobacteria bacterium]|nr:heme NO-binding protein [Gammaproteobacteria bacterium]